MGHIRYLIASFLLLSLALAPISRGEELKQRQSTIKGMVVRSLGNGKYTGMAVGIVATAGKVSRSTRPSRSPATSR